MLSSESPEGVRIRGTGKLFFFGVFETKWEYSGGRTERTRLVYDLSVWVHMEEEGDTYLKKRISVDTQYVR